MSESNKYLYFLSNMSSKYYVLNIIFTLVVTTSNVFAMS